MKKTFQAAVLVVMAASAVIAAATSRHSRANSDQAGEWEKTITISSDSFAALQAIKYSNTIKK